MLCLAAVSIVAKAEKTTVFLEPESLKALLVLLQRYSCGNVFCRTTFVHCRKECLRLCKQITNAQRRQSAIGLLTSSRYAMPWSPPHWHALKYDAEVSRTLPQVHESLQHELINAGYILGGLSHFESQMVLNHEEWRPSLHNDTEQPAFGLIWPIHSLAPRKRLRH